MKVAIGCDHIVTEIKDHMKEYLEEKGFEVIDCGTYDKVRTHYPIYGKRVADLVASKQVDYGVVMCGTGVGITNAAQKVKGARVALVGDVDAARYAKAKLNCNIIGVGGRVSGVGMIEDIIDTFFDTDFEGTEEEIELVNKIDSLIDNTEGMNDEHYFDEFIEKWDRGEYHD